MEEAKPRIGWIGLGKMGRPMAARLVGAGYEVTAYRRRTDTPPLAGAVAMVDDLAALAASSDIAVSMISDDAALDSVASGLLPALAPGAVYVDMSTVSPAASARVARAAKARAVNYLRAPVVGSTGLAATGELLVLASGPAAALEAVAPVLAHLGRGTQYLGEAEEARHMKLALSLMVALSAATLGEGLLFAEKGGVARDRALDVIAESALASPMMKAKIPALKAQDFAPMFTVRQMAKDIDIVRENASELGVALPHLALVRSFYEALFAAGAGEQDFIAYVRMLERLSGLAAAGEAT